MLPKKYVVIYCILDVNRRNIDIKTPESYLCPNFFDE